MGFELGLTDSGLHPRGGGLPYETDGDELGLNLTPKGDHQGVAQAFCVP